MYPDSIETIIKLFKDWNVYADIATVFYTTTILKRIT